MTRVRTRSTVASISDLGFFEAFETESDVGGDRHVREQGVMLEHRIHRALIGFEILDLVIEQHDFTAGNLLKAGDQAQQGGFAATGGT